MAWAGRLAGALPALQSFRIEPQRLPQRDVTLDIAPFTSRSLELFVFPPKAGRMFSFADPSCRVAVVNEEADRALFAGETAGRSIRDPSGPPTQIIGVLAARKGQLAPRRPTLFLYHADESGPAFDRVEMAHFRAPAISELSRSELDANVVSTSYFAAMGFSLVAGRLFSDDPKPHECRVGVVNREATDLYFGGDAVGAAVIDESGSRTEIIGVVNSPPLGTFQRRTEPAIYFPMAQDYLPRMTLIMGTREASDSLLTEVSRKIESTPGRGPAPIVIKTLDTHLAQTALAPLRIATVIISASAATALLLSIAGLYGTLDDAARRRSRELAIRIALGAKRADIIFQVLRQGAMLAGSGILISLGATLLLAKLLRAITPGSKSPALLAWLAGPIVLAGAIAISSILPARRALMVDPINILREEN